MTVHTGTSEHDYNEQTIEVAALHYFVKGSDWLVEAELGAQYRNSQQAALQAQVAQTVINTVRPPEFRTLLVTIGDRSTVIATGVKGSLPVQFPFTILGWTALADVSGSIQVDVYKDTRANHPANNSDSITASDPIVISSQDEAEDLAPTGWTVDVASGDTLTVRSRFLHVDQAGNDRDQGPDQLVACWELGDIAIVSFGHLHNSIPGLASGLTAIGAGGSQAGGPLGIRTGYRILLAGDSSASIGAFSGAASAPDESWDCVIYRGQHATPIGKIGGTGGTTTTTTFPALTSPLNGGSTSWVIGLAHGNGSGANMRGYAYRHGQPSSTERPIRSTSGDSRYQRSGELMAVADRQYGTQQLAVAGDRAPRSGIRLARLCRCVRDQSER